MPWLVLGLALLVLSLARSALVAQQGAVAGLGLHGKVEIGCTAVRPTR